MASLVCAHDLNDYETFQFSITHTKNSNDNHIKFLYDLLQSNKPLRNPTLIYRSDWGKSRCLKFNVLLFVCMTVAKV
jgi:hypothetical protein